MERPDLNEPCPLIMSKRKFNTRFVIVILSCENFFSLSKETFCEIYPICQICDSVSCSSTYRLRQCYLCPLHLIGQNMSLKHPHWQLKQSRYFCIISISSFARVCTEHSAGRARNQLRGNRFVSRRGRDLVGDKKLGPRPRQLRAWHQARLHARSKLLVLRSLNLIIVLEEL